MADFFVSVKVGARVNSRRRSGAARKASSTFLGTLERRGLARRQFQNRTKRGSM